VVDLEVEVAEMRLPLLKDLETHRLFHLRKAMMVGTETLHQDVLVEGVEHPQLDKAGNRLVVVMAEQEVPRPSLEPL